MKNLNFEYVGYIPSAETDRWLRQRLGQLPGTVWLSIRREAAQRGPTARYQLRLRLKLCSGTVVVRQRAETNLRLALSQAIGAARRKLRQRPALFGPMRATAALALGRQTGDHR